MFSKIAWGVGIACILASPVMLRTLSRPPSVNVNVEPAVQRVIRDSVLASGNLIYKDEARLTSEIIARVNTITVREGASVDKGQVLIYLDDQDIRQAIALQRAQLDMDVAAVERQQITLSNAQDSYNRVNKLFQQGMVAKSAYDDAMFKWRSAKADLVTAERNVDRTKAALAQADVRMRQTVIRAPISGTVVAIGIKPGETAVPSVTGVPGSSLITVVKEKSILVDLNVDENDISKLRLNYEAQVNCPTAPDDSIKGQITDIAKSPRSASRTFAPNDPAGRSYSVEVKLGEDSALRAGMSCRAKIFTSQPDPTLSVSVQAVMSDQMSDNDGVSVSQSQNSRAERYVFVASNGRAEKRVVTIGAADDQYLEIKTGLKKDESVIIGPPSILNSIHNQSPVSPARS